MVWNPLKIVSGGQTGVDRAALDVALSLGITVGGWCPKGRRAEDGPIDSKYPLEETPTDNYAERTEWNVRDSDATLILTLGEIEGGTKMTAEFAKSHGKPHYIVDLNDGWKKDELSQWLEEKQVKTLNVAGPRASKQPTIYALVCKVLGELLK